MKVIALILTAALIGSTAYAEDTASLVSTDRSARLVAIDGNKVDVASTGRYAVPAGTRELEFELMIPSATAPGKSFGGAPTPTNRFVTTKATLEAGKRYTLHVDKSARDASIAIR